jgi:N-acylglucosamine-6-phosphate 2-epimerase
MKISKSEPDEIFSRLRGGLIVSCQALPDEPLYGPQYMAAMARAAMEGGGIGIRANSPPDIAAIRQVVPLPIIGIYKIDLPNYPVRITPTLDSALQVAQAGADIIAVDATFRPRPEFDNPQDFIRAVQDATGLAVMADISCLEEGIAAAEAGASLIATTLSGYTGPGPVPEAPDFVLIHRLSETIQAPVIAEGRISTPSQARQALEAGAFAVVVGTAITRPQWITRQFAEALRKPRKRVFRMKRIGE